jgi:hypothetical protein
MALAAAGLNRVNPSFWTRPSRPVPVNPTYAVTDINSSSLARPALTCTDRGPEQALDARRASAAVPLPVVEFGFPDR